MIFTMLYVLALLGASGWWALRDYHVRWFKYVGGAQQHWTRWPVRLGRGYVCHPGDEGFHQFYSLTVGPHVFMLKATRYSWTEQTFRV